MLYRWRASSASGTGLEAVERQMKNESDCGWLQGSFLLHERCVQPAHPEVNRTDHNLLDKSVGIFCRVGGMQKRERMGGVTIEQSIVIATDC